MKIVRTFRIDKDFFENVKALAQSQGITFSQFVELACYAMADEQPKPIKQEESKGKKVEKILLDFGWINQHLKTLQRLQSLKIPPYRKKSITVYRQV